MNDLGESPYFSVLLPEIRRLILDWCSPPHDYIHSVRYAMVCRCCLAETRGARLLPSDLIPRSWTERLLSDSDFRLRRLVRKVTAMGIYSGELHKDKFHDVYMPEIMLHLNRRLIMTISWCDISWEENRSDSVDIEANVDLGDETVHYIPTEPYSELALAPVTLAKDATFEAWLSCILVKHPIDCTHCLHPPYRTLPL